MTHKTINPETGKYATLFRKNVVHELDPGIAFIATKGKDFTCEPESFGSYVRAAAALRGLSASVTVVGTHVIYAYFAADALWRPNFRNYPIVRKYRR